MEQNCHYDAFSLQRWYFSDNAKYLMEFTEFAVQMAGVIYEVLRLYMAMEKECNMNYVYGFHGFKAHYAPFENNYWDVQKSNFRL